MSRNGPPGRWHWNTRLARWELVIARVFTASACRVFGTTTYEWRLYGNPSVGGIGKSLYAAQRAARKALRETRP